MVCSIAMASTIGVMFRVTTWGESHGPAVGVVVDGCPPGLSLTEAPIQSELDRRRPGQSRITTQRQELDTVEITSGVFERRTTGTPIHLLVRNSDARSADYDEMQDKYRPSHADYTYDAKYGVRDWRGGGRASARETVGRVAAGAIAQMALRELWGVEIVSYVLQVADIRAALETAPTRQSVEAHITRCPDPTAAAHMEKRIDAARKAGDSLGGIVECTASGVPPGLGEPVFDKLDADLAKALLSLPACKGFEVGSGFGGVTMTGSTHNDPFYMEAARVRTHGNRSGGIQGGISNGEDVLVRAAFKPTATILREQDTVNRAGEETTLRSRGRHDPCVLPRAVPLVDAMVAIVLIDHALRQRGQNGVHP
jgi:chorismate synthase